VQYFFTIKDLREAVAPLRTIEQEKAATKDMSNCRVGGRLVSQREVYRSQACAFSSRLIAQSFLLILSQVVSQLASLFTDMECSSDLSVTPSLELAKLALVTSKDEEDEEILTRPDNTDSSNSTDATLVEESLPGLTPMNNATVEGSSSILGKRGRADLQVADTATADGDVDMQDASMPVPQPPPLPPRRKSEVNTSSVMMFGTFTLLFGGSVYLQHILQGSSTT
jgi:ubiquitin carboxyl-terminal hydrolase 25/28